jgi:hypothetical protein
MKKVIYLFLILIFLIIGYILVPKQVFLSGFWWLAIPFIVSFALVTTCTIRNLRLRFQNGGGKKGLLASFFGFGALQVCGLSAYACSTALGFSILASILPHSILVIFQQYSVFIILISIVVQIYALFQLDCVKLLKK